MLAYLDMIVRYTLRLFQGLNMHSLLRAIVAIAVASLVAGCHFAADSLQELKDKPATIYQFDVPGNYQATYKTLTDAARHCFNQGSFGSSMTVEADLLPDLKRGTISVAANQFGEQYWMTSEIIPTPPGGTHVTVWNYRHGWDYVGPRMKAWAAGDTSCR